MPPDWPTVLLRFALYLDLMLVFGLPFFVVHGLRGDERQSRFATSVRYAAVGGAIAGLLLSVGNLLLMAKALSGVAQYALLDRETVGMVLTATDFGLAWSVRMAALLAVLLAFSIRRLPHALRLGSATVAAAVALATLAWSGHGAMDEGVRRYVHLGADIAHLLAAGTWVGALLAFVCMAAGVRRATTAEVAMLARAASEFARVGTLVVATLVLTGAINYWLIVGPSLAGIASTGYGQLLLAKLALFGAMLGLAAFNRYRFSPRLAAALASGEARSAAAALRRSLWLETGCATAILALVAWLGTLSPEALQGG
ncbi:copper homeostasis membrane protein CopD [Cupriavidus sp. UGS-1]|uniref:copper homeostasis membrane protein CopD n=1 Tax=Cupriavidus sp. UGS-1 TaxID=2899826 RepID=UPI001E580526|nr:copper homeostasis membrane protein CopD [Cupriavidus sp. UGS-1]MCD9121839.1 copper homeostasis membrane protein CopD [Cupriavidus sp. UGS-1]